MPLGQPSGMLNPLRSYLTRSNIKASAFAGRIGVSRSYLSRLLSGDRKADASLLSAITAETGGIVTADEWVRWWGVLRGAEHGPQGADNGARG